MSSLRNKTSKALAWDLVGNYGGQATSFIISIFLARLLSPEDFGLVGMSMVFIAILRVFADMGFASALVQNRDNSSLTYSSIFFLNIFIGLLFTVILFLAAPLIGDFYDNGTVTRLVKLLSIVFFINSFNIVQGTILRKRLDFKRISIILLTSQVIAGIVAVMSAYQGLGVYALVIQQILIGLINVIFLWKVADWRPRMEFSWQEVKKLTGFSTYVFSGQFINQIFKQLDTLAVGKFFSPATLGYFSRAESINSLISKNSVSTFNRVFFPVLSSIQDDNEKFERVFLKVLELVAVSAIFLSGAFYLIGEELIITLFGQKWKPSVVIFQILVIKGFAYPISALVVNAFFAKGKSKANFHYGNIRRLLNLIPLVIAYFYGFDYFLYALVTISILGWILNAYFVQVSIGIRFWLQVKSVLLHLAVVVFLIGTLSFLLPQGFSYLWSGLSLLLFTFYFWVYLKVTNSIVLIEIEFYKNKLWRKFAK
ncbi:lipopolysaccharide biosynthesis protein [Fulvivirga sp. 29W222]|uniref:Lipopolysaccharide biosynthesis protein n=1 Tax=Fulvivirga marina TaxID=2494733 RepID=A0A937KAQ2_9BACT|nr:lipopolysaccharide biosynthesis protein [Fulvivirga marina]MBL6444754.1 lipopolysaccharide biosynthesis protein [Fulvivirga marina]